MTTYCILTMEDSFRPFDYLFDLARELREKAPQIDWMVGEDKILISNHTYENRLCLKVPKVQYDAAKYLYHLANGFAGDPYTNDPIFISLEENIDYLTYFCSYSVEETKLEDYLNTLLKILSEVYLLGTQITQGIDLHLIPEFEGLYGSFSTEWNLDDELLQEKINKIGENIDFILNETSKYYPPFEENNLITAGIIYELYQTFHSLDGWGMKLLETFRLIHQLKNCLKVNQSVNVNGIERGTSLKEAATSWLKERICIDRILLRNDYKYFYDHLLLDTPNVQDSVYSFQFKGFADEPEVFVQPTDDGVNFGYYSISWESHTPVPRFAVKHTLSWEALEHLTETEKEALAFDKLLKTINSRKRQYKMCQFCGEKVPPEHSFNAKTCHGCATEHFHAIY
jgi:hypothetical protein